jgi:serine/threonine protein kinase
MKGNDSSTLSAGSRLGPYEIVSLLETGAMGEVYGARDSRLERDVALKILPRRLASDARLRRFEQEARLTGSLNHPNIVALYDVGRENGLSYLVTELLTGQTLRALLRRGPLATHRAVDYGIQAARGLSVAHEKRIIHRDLKPANLFVTRDARLKILDFGLAKLMTAPASDESLDEDCPTLDKQDDSPTRPGSILGTINYMSPEQVQGLPVDHRSDLFALGTVLFEMLVGHNAFKAATLLDTMNAILQKEPPELARPTGGLPRDLVRIVRRCLEKKPEDRFQSARDLAFDLETAAEVPRFAGWDIRTGLPSVMSAMSSKDADLVAAFALGILTGRSHPRGASSASAASGARPRGRRARTLR